jgi:hypothetical protein
MTMKKLLITAFALVSFTFATGQSQKISYIESGRFFTGGTFNFQVISVTAGKNLLSGRVTPNVGYFIFDNFAMGYRGDIDVSNSGESRDYRNILFVHYNLPVSNRISIFANVGAGVGYRMNQSPIDKNVRVISNGRIFNSRLGMGYFINRSVILETTANFDASQLNTTFADGKVSESVTRRAAFMVGFQILL